jgi:hypothetical protein
VFGDTSTPLNKKVATTAKINAMAITTCRLNKQKQVRVADGIPAVTFILDKGMTAYFHDFIDRLIEAHNTS